MEDNADTCHDLTAFMAVKRTACSPTEPVHLSAVELLRLTRCRPVHWVCSSHWGTPSMTQQQQQQRKDAAAAVCSTSEPGSWQVQPVNFDLTASALLPGSSSCSHHSFLKPTHQLQPTSCAAAPRRRRAPAARARCPAAPPPPACAPACRASPQTPPPPAARISGERTATLHAGIYIVMHACVACTAVYATAAHAG